VARLVDTTTAAGQLSVAAQSHRRLDPNGEIGSYRRMRRSGGRVSYVRDVTRFPSFARRYAVDVLVVVAALEAAAEVVLRHGTPGGAHVTLWFALPAIVVVVLPLLARRRYPFAAPVSVWLLAAAISFVDGNLIASTGAVLLAGMAAAFLTGGLDDAVEARIGLACVVAGAAIVVSNQPGHTPGDFVFTPSLFAIAWLAGFALRQRAAQTEAAEARAAYSEREREVAARIAVAEERARIAREMHDIVAHAVSVMVLHVGAVRHHLPDTMTEDREALERVERAGRSALAEMRRLLGAMRHDGEDLELAPQPGLDRLDALLEEVGRAGLPVRLHLDGDAVALPRAIDLSAYRIIQEGLTNALKHAGASRADVTVRYHPSELQIEVRDDGRGVVVGDGRGHGLVGVAERVKIYGGEMRAGASAGGGFVLGTRLPLGRDRS
jgi:signal transduction histidine kinase